MKISRYIKFPLIFGLLMTFPTIFLNSAPTLNQFLLSFIYGAVFGVGMQIYSDYRTRKIKPDAGEKDFDIQQTKQKFLLCSYDEAFNLCLESVTFLKKGNVTYSDQENGIIAAKTGMTWNSFGTDIDFRLKSITDNATEISISAKPILATTLIDGGESVEAVKTITDFLARKNEDLNYKILEEKFEIPIEYISQNAKTTIKN
ncbi:MAG TPA: hypothetical protein PKY82_34905 [Pyrinomonadaceae bacterium]|nr:hypothetical protein [Pyrinomonadaceae bacterium]